MDKSADKCTKPNCDCLEKAEEEAGGPVKRYPCLASFTGFMQDKSIRTEPAIPSEGNEEEQELTWKLLLLNCINGMPKVKIKQPVRHASSNEGIVTVIKNNGRHRGVGVLFPGLDYDTWFNDSDDTDKRSRYLRELTILEPVGKESGDEAIEFAEWIVEKYTRIYSDELQKSAWVNFQENEVLVNGSDYHFTRLIKEFGQTTVQLYQLFKNP